MKKRILGLFLVAILLLLTLTGCDETEINNKTNGKALKVLCCSENQDLEPILSAFAAERNANITIDYAGTLDIISKLNGAAASEYDAVWLSNSIWTSNLNNSSLLSNGKSIFISPIVFAIDRDEGERLGLIGRDVTMRELMNAITESGTEFIIPNVTRTNSGASIYLSILSTLVGNPEVMTIAQISHSGVKEELQEFFGQVSRTSGSEDYLLELISGGEYHCMVNYESQIIALNRKLEEMGRAPMYILYPTDGVSIGDAPLYFINNHSEKLAFFLELQQYLLSSEIQDKLLTMGFRGGYGGLVESKYADIFKPEYGVNGDRCLSPVKYPSSNVIREALHLYQTAFKKSTAIVFCLDYSGSMYGNGISQLRDAMDYILDNSQTETDFLEFTENDSVTVLRFSGQVDDWETSTGEALDVLNQFVRNNEPEGQTDIYAAALKAFDILQEYPDDYNKSVVLMTDGMSNEMTFDEFKWTSTSYDVVPVYTIMFGEADEAQVTQLAKETGGKVFDGTKNLTGAFREVRGYN